MTGSILSCRTRQGLYSLTTPNEMPWPIQKMSNVMHIHHAATRLTVLEFSRPYLPYKHKLHREANLFDFLNKLTNPAQ